eukprot:gene27142-biopygen17692
MDGAHISSDEHTSELQSQGTI